MTAVLVVAVLVVLGHQAWRARGHGADCADRHTGVSAWHALMAVAMAAMLAFTLPPLLAAAGAVLFTGGALWAGGAALHTPARRDGRRALHVRLGVACSAMVVMLWSGATTGAAAAPGPGTAEAPAGGRHHGSVLAAVHDHGAAAGSPTGTWLAAAAVLAVLVVAVVSARRAVLPGARGSRVETRADACCETYMALLAAGMLAGPLLAAAGA